jgi:hypothetical protein
MTRHHVLVSGMNYKTGEPHRMSWTDAEVQAAGLLLIAHADGRFQLGTPLGANWNMTQVAYHLEQIAHQIRTDAAHLDERQAKMTDPDRPHYKPSDYGITPLGDHLAASHRRGIAYAIALGLLAAITTGAFIASGYQLSGLIAGLVALLIASLLAGRSRRADHRETDRLMDEDIVREFGPWKKP